MFCPVVFETERVWMVRGEKSASASENLVPGFVRVPHTPTTIFWFPFCNSSLVTSQSWPISSVDLYCTSDSYPNPFNCQLTNSPLPYPNYDFLGHHKYTTPFMYWVTITTRLTCFIVWNLDSSTEYLENEISSNFSPNLLDLSIGSGVTLQITK